MTEPGTGARSGRASRTFSAASQSAARAGRSFASASQSAARGSAAVAGGAGRVVHHMTRASGAGRTGLANLIELTAASSVADAFVTVALAGSLFFSTSLEQARSEVAIAMVVTIAPFTLLAPLVGPMLDRVQQGRRFILAGTLLARGLLCWGMSAALHGEAVTLLPAAFGVLILQKAYQVTRAAVTPRLLPAELTLVSANARSNLAALIASTLGVALAAGLDWAFGAAWVLRAGTLIYLAGTVLGIRLPGSVDAPDPLAGAPGPQQPGPAGRTAAAPRAASRGGLGTLRSVGPIVGEAMRGNAALRAFSGFLLFFLAFLLRADHFRGLPHNAALGALGIAVAAGGFIGTALGSRLRSRRPHLIVFGMLSVATVVSAACAWFFGLWAALIVAFVAATAQVLVKLALDSTVQRDIGEDIRSSTFAVSETLNQLSWVIGGLAGLALSLTNSGVAGLTVAAVGLASTLALLVAGRRRRTVTAQSLAHSGSPA